MARFSAPPMPVWRRLCFWIGLAGTVGGFVGAINAQGRHKTRAVFGMGARGW